jgi:hypothetical protein
MIASPTYLLPAKSNEVLTRDDVGTPPNPSPTSLVPVETLGATLVQADRRSLLMWLFR